MNCYFSHTIVSHEANHDLGTACINNDFDAVHTLLYSSEVNVQNSDGNTPLHHACHHGNLDIVQTLLSMLPDTSITNDPRRTPCETAKYFGNSDVVWCFSWLISADNMLDTRTRATATASAVNDADNVVTDVQISGVQSTRLPVSGHRSNINKLLSRKNKQYVHIV